MLVHISMMLHLSEGTKRCSTPLGAQRETEDMKSFQRRIAAEKTSQTSPIHEEPHTYVKETHLVGSFPRRPKRPRRPYHHLADDAYGIIGKLFGIMPATQS